MIIRKLQKEDAPALQECRLFGLRESPESLLLTYAEVADSPLSLLEAELADANIHWLGAFDGDELVGFMRFVRFQRQARQHVAEVRSVYVKASARGHGIGARLLRLIVADARSAGIESLILSVLEDNAAARKLYEACGFRVYGTEPRAVKKDDRYVGQSQYHLDLAR
jgi:ribosomal protein S18 acetylase RimI-like enzyme